MSDDILALKYRPKKMSELIGQDNVRTILSNSITTGDLHHAYIFCGNLGSGKTSSARLFAACLNNPSKPSLEPDLNSKIIQSIFEGKNIDVKEIDAASQRGIDDIRALKESISYAPIECRFKFVILDEAHRLSGAAAESALKMIEEPPPGVIFILCTTDPQKLKDTIHSRCLVLKFNKIPNNIISKHLSDVSSMEKVEIDDGAIKIAARASKQSMRNALQNLQLLITYAAGKRITTELAEMALSVLDETRYFDLVDEITKPDAGAAMRVIDQLLTDGRDIGDVLNGLVDHIRNLYLSKLKLSSSGLSFLTETEIKKYEMQAAKVRIELIFRMIELITEISSAINKNINPQTCLEVFVIKSIIEDAGLKAQHRANNVKTQSKDS